MQRFKKNERIDSSLRTSQFFVDIIDDTEDFYFLNVKFFLKKSTIVKNNLTKVTVKLTNPDVVKNINEPFLSYSPAGVGDGAVATAESPMTRPTVSTAGNAIAISSKFKYASNSSFSKDINVSNAGSTNLSGASISGELGSLFDPLSQVHNPGGNITTYSGQTNGGPIGPKMTVTKLTKSYAMIAKTYEKSQTVIDSSNIVDIEQSVSQKAIDDLRNFYASSDRTKDITSLQSMYETIDVLEPVDSIDNRATDTRGKMTHESVKRANMNLLVNFKVDPANLLSEDAQYTRKYRNSLIKPSNKQDYPYFDSIKKYYEFDSIESFKRTNKNAQYKLAKRRIFWDRVDFYTTLKLPKKLQIPTANIEFFVYKSGAQSPIDVQVKKLSVVPLTDAYDARIEEVPEIANISHQYINNLSIKNEKKISNADSIAVSKKVMGERGNFSHMLEISKKNIFEDKPAFVVSNTAPGKINIHRTYLYNSKTNARSNRYRSIITGDIQYDPAVLIVTAPKRTQASSTGMNEVKRGISFEVKNFPRMPNEWVVGWNVRWENGQGGYEYLTRNSSDWLPVDSSSDSLVYEWDPSGKLQPKRTYKMELLYRYNTGRIKQSYVSEYRWNRTAYEDEVTTTISSPTYNASPEGPVLSFRITTVVPPKSMNKVIESFKSARIFEEFAEYFDTSNTSDLFSKIVQHKVDRINLETAERVTFGDFGLDVANLDSGEFLFNDTPEVRQRLKIDYDPTASYLYEVRVSLSDPITLLPEYAIERDITLPGGAVKRIKYNPFTWYQPNLLGTGILPSLDEKNRPVLSLSSEDDFHEPGEIGVTAVYATNGEMLKEYKVSNLVASRVDINNVKITWSVMNDGLYDHFVIVKETNGTKKILDVSHTNYAYDDVDYQESGNVTYYVTPVFNNYAVGGTTKSNTIFFDNNDFIRTNPSANTALLI